MSIINMRVSTLNPDGTSTEVYRSNPGDSEETIMREVANTFPSVEFAPVDFMDAIDAIERPRS